MQTDRLPDFKKEVEVQPKIYSCAACGTPHMVVFDHIRQHRAWSDLQHRACVERQFSLRQPREPIQYEHSGMSITEWMNGGYHKYWNKPAAKLVYGAGAVHHLHYPPVDMVAKCSAPQPGVPQGSPDPDTGQRRPLSCVSQTFTPTSYMVGKNLAAGMRSVYPIGGEPAALQMAAEHFRGQLLYLAVGILLPTWFNDRPMDGAGPADW